MAKLNGIQKNQQFEEIKIPVPWGHISGKWWGSRTVQPILAIHGWQDNAGTFDNLAPLLLERGHSVLCIDLPGHGLSSHYPTGQYYYIFWDGVPVLRRIVEFFNWTNITVIGHSLGGCIGFLYSSIFPDDIDKYISLDTAGAAYPETAKLLDQLEQHIDRFLKFETILEEDQPCYEYDEMIDIVEKAYDGGVTRENCEIMMIRGMQPVDYKPNCYQFQRDPRLKVGWLGYITIEQAIEIASRIKCDVLNIRANRDNFIGLQNYNRILDAIGTNARTLERHVVDGTHHLHLNNPERIIDIILNFLISNTV